MDSEVVTVISAPAYISNNYESIHSASCSGVTTDIHWKYSAEGGYPSSALFTDLGLTFPSAPLLNVESLKARALRKAWAGQELSTFQTMVFAAELKESVASIRDLYKGLAKLLRNFRNSACQLKKLASAKEIAERHMYLRYALRPMIYDIVAAIETLEGKTKSIGERFTSRGYTEDRITTNTPRVFNYASYIDGACLRRLTIEFNVMTDVKVEVRSGVLSQITALSTLNKWGLDQPLEALWEIIPLSFVLDWFFDVGTAIAAFTPEYGLKALASWSKVSTLTTRNVTLVSAGSSMDTVGTGYTATTSYDLDGFSYMETSLKTERIPEPRLSIIPNFKVKLDPLKVIDLAIIAQQFLRKKR
jgi:hypothetical protein